LLVCTRRPVLVCLLHLFLTLLCFITPDAWATSTEATAIPAPIRFALSFDDGPSAADSNNPTVKVLEVLANNKVQSGIKALFFVQTRSRNGGATDIGQSLLRREFDEGHLLGFHTTTPRHSNHRFLTVQELELSLQAGVADLTAITGKAPTLVRPPFWNYDERTLAAYQQHGMRLLLTDLSANDGKTVGINFSLTKRHNMRKMLTEFRQRWLVGAVPVVDGIAPVVVTFHDINTYTASHIEEYLSILIDVARELGMPTASKAFYDERDELERAALTSTARDGEVKAKLPGLWNWLWQ
jgi:peptidoglycan/xylan/chitin deacetylase (PgdA/CDA1 family)